MDKSCPITKTMNRLSRKWAFHILREMSGNHKYGELLKEMKGISPRTLSKSRRAWA